MIPAYNEAKNLPTVVDKAIAAAQKYGLTSKEFGLIIVDNGSKDGTRGVLHRLLKSDQGPWIIARHIPENQGYGDGIYQGLLASTAPYVGWTHADQQCPPDDAFRCLVQIQNTTEALVLKGKRIQRAFKDRAFSKVFETLASLILQTRLSEINAQPKVFSRKLLPLLSSPPLDFAFDLYVLYTARRAGYRIAEIPVLFPERTIGESNWSSRFVSKYSTIFKMLRYLVKLRLSRWLTSPVGTLSPQNNL